MLGVNVSSVVVPGWEAAGPLDLYRQLRAFYCLRDGSRVFSNNVDNNGTAEWWAAGTPELVLVYQCACVRVCVCVRVCACT
jgi:hypothetical protein